MGLSKLKEIREQKKMTRSELSLLTGITVEYISKIERDIADPKLSQLLKISRVLNLDLKVSDKYNHYLEEKIG